MSYVKRMIHFFWPAISDENISRFGILSSIYFFLIGAYWLIRTMKDPLFASLVGYSYQPFAKMVSLITVILGVLFYNKLLDVLRRNTLFYSLALFFGIGFVIIGYCTLPTTQVFLENPSWLQWVPGRLLGWVAYCFIELYGSLMPALFLSIIASTISASSAKTGWGLLAFFAQLGAILGAGLVTLYTKTLGIGVLFAIGGASVCILPFLMRWYIKTTDIEASATGEKPQKTSMIEGLKLILSRPYVAGLLVVTVTYEIISTIVEFQMGLCATQIYPTAADGGAGFAWLKGLQGVSTNTLALVFALLGTSFFMRKFGLKFCLVSYPALIGSSIVILLGMYLCGATTYTLMWGFFASVIMYKAFSYTLNNPSKEVIYIPTSKDVKFKAKSWIDGFANRTSKAIGSTVTASLGSHFPTLFIFGSFISLGFILGWILVALFMGTTFNKLQEEQKIIE